MSSYLTALLDLSYNFTIKSKLSLVISRTEIEHIAYDRQSKF